MDIHTKIPLPEGHGGFVYCDDIPEMIVAAMRPEIMADPLIKDCLLKEYREALWCAVDAGKLTPRAVLSRLPIPPPFDVLTLSPHAFLISRGHFLLATDDLKRWGESVGIAFEETKKDRRARLKAEHEELKAGGDKQSTKTLAGKHGISEGRVRQLIRGAKTPKAGDFPTRSIPKAR